jgi:hypothetical protein
MTNYGISVGALVRENQPNRECHDCERGIFERAHFQTAPLCPALRGNVSDAASGRSLLQLTERRGVERLQQLADQITADRVR